MLAPIRTSLNDCKHQDIPCGVRLMRTAQLQCAAGTSRGGWMKITVVGAGKYGSTTVQRLAEMRIADEVVMTDIVEGLPQGLALDMMQSRPIEGFETRVVGTNTYAETTGSDICVVTAGLPRKPGISRIDLLEVNAKIITHVAAKF